MATLKYSPEFIRFVNASPTPYHAVHNAIGMLKDHGFTELKEQADWKVKPGQNYYVTRNGSSLIAFSVGGKYQPGNGIAVVGCHTDSPTLRIKPISKKSPSGYLNVGVETYGGGSWPTWFDRDLSIAGRVYVSENGRHVPKLVKIDKPILRIPTIAIHLHREQGTKLEFNPENQLEPVLGLVKSELEGNMDGHHHPSMVRAIAKELGVKPDAIEDFELVLYDTQDATLAGLEDEFVFSPRLDNLCSSYCAVEGLVNAQETVSGDDSIRMIALFDHEEVGSQSAQGAGSNFLEAVMKRLAGASPYQALSKSFILSADMAHAVHPNYASKHEVNHTPQLNQGPVIKVNAMQRYATNSPGMVLIKDIAKKAGVPIQIIVVRNDSPCGSTIGPILATRLGVRTLDIGNPQLSMHSIREMCGSQDIEFCVKLFAEFFDSYSAVQATIDV